VDLASGGYAVVLLAVLAWNALSPPLARSIVDPLVRGEGRLSEARRSEWRAPTAIACNAGTKRLGFAGKQSLALKTFAL
jgi:hypothetical protein